MSDPIDKLPPAPGKAGETRQGEIEKRSQTAEEIENSPSCGRKLLTTRSVLCNWCGARIEDEDYLERAAKARAAQDAAERERLEQELVETARYGVRGRLKRVAKTVKRPSIDDPTLGSP